MSGINDKTGGLSDGPPLRRDHSPEMARSLAGKGRMGGEPAGSPSVDATAGRLRPDRDPDMAGSSICKGNEEEDRIKERKTSENLDDIEDDNEFKFKSSKTKENKTDSADSTPNSDLDRTLINEEEKEDKASASEERTIAMINRKAVVSAQSDTPMEWDEAPKPQRIGAKRKAIKVSDDSSDSGSMYRSTSRVVLTRRKKTILDTSVEDGLAPDTMSDDSIEEESCNKKKKKRNRKDISIDVKSLLSPGLNLTNKSNNSGAQSLGEKALQLLEEIDESRAKSKNLQGRTSGNMKARIGSVKTIVETLVDRITDLGDPAFLRQENKELKTMMRETNKNWEELKEQMEKLTRQMAYLTEENESLKKELSEYKNRTNRELNKGNKGNKDEEKKINRPRDLPLKQSKITAKPRIIAIEEGTFITPDKLARMGVDKVIADTKKIDEEIDRLCEIRTRISAKYLDTPEEEQIPRTKEKIINRTRNNNDDVDYINEFPQLRKKNIRFTEYETDEDPSRDEERLREERRMEQRREPVQRRKTTTPKKRIRRTPKNAVVSIKAQEKELREGKTYAEIIKLAKNEVKLTEFGGENARIRKALNGSIIVEIPGNDGQEKAEKLREKLDIILKNKARVTRPVVKGEARISNFDESLTQEEIAGTVATATGGRITDFSVSTIRGMRNGMYMAWIKGPLTYIDRLANLEKIRLGWSLARVDQSRSCRIQCFRCWQFGHIATTCCAEVDRTGSCFKCGSKGHKSKECRKKNNCVLCEEAGMEANHRVGSFYCQASVAGSNLKKKTNISTQNRGEHSYAKY